MTNCVLCNETLRNTSASGLQPIHRQCALRSVVGGIGHLLDHQHWCVGKSDPDAGLDYRTSALLVDELVNRMGPEWAAAR